MFAYIVHMQYNDFVTTFFCQEKKEEIELAQDSVSLGTDVNYMGIIPTERFMIDMVS